MDSPESIHCGVTGWFYRRTILPGLICLVLAGWFCFDGFVGYPQRMRVYQEYRAYTLQRELLLQAPSDPQHQRAQKEWARAAKTYPGFTPALRWADLAPRFGWAPTNPPEWREYARTKGYFQEPAKKDRVMPSDIAGQFVAGALFLVAALAFLLNALRASRTCLRSDAQALHLPSGQSIPFALIVRVDNRKWTEQGLSRITWKDAEGKLATAKLDCLKYDETGAERIMQRILATPGIEVIAS